MKKTYLDADGYLRFIDSDILVHRYFAELKLGRKLYPWEVVHHINRIKTDNRPENLWVFSNQYSHSKIHRIDLYNNGVW
jgi:hypothetical protein